jgi:hypothetical protein
MIRYFQCLSPCLSMKIPGWYLTISHDRFRPHSFPLHSTIRRYGTTAVVNVSLNTSQICHIVFTMRITNDILFFPISDSHSNIISKNFAPLLTMQALRGRVAIAPIYF